MILSSPRRLPLQGKRLSATCFPAQASVAWLSARPEYWPVPHGGGELHGIMCVQFGVGSAGVGWLARLAGSSWFAGLQPRFEDCTVAGGFPDGGWIKPASFPSEEEGHLTAAAEAFFTSASLPKAWYATVAIPCGAEPGEGPVALGLVSALRQRSDPLGRRLAVFVTIAAGHDPGNSRLVRQLLGLGAFVLCADAQGSAAGSDHLHHFPLRATVRPRHGRLICVDLADYLHTWQPGRLAGLHVLPFGCDSGLTLRELPSPKAGSGVCALNIGFHLDLRSPGNPLAEIDRFATRHHELLLPAGGDAVFTNTDRLDGKVGSADLLVIRERGAR